MSKYPYAILNVYANNTVVTRHCSIKNAFRSLNKLRNRLKTSIAQGNSIPPWDYGIWDGDHYRRISKEDKEIKDMLWHLKHPNDPEY